MAKFLLAKCRFTDPSPNEEMLEEMGVAVSPTFITDYFALNLDEVACFNPATGNDGVEEISVGLKSGDRFLIQISFSDFCGVIHEHIGQILEMVKR